MDIFRPALIGIWHFGVNARRVLAAGEGVKQQNGVRFGGVELAVGFVGDRDLRKLGTGGKSERFLGASGMEKFGFCCFGDLRHEERKKQGFGVAARRIAHGQMQ